MCVNILILCIIFFNFEFLLGLPCIILKHPKIRTFYTIKSFRNNLISFDSRKSNFDGNYVYFKVGKIKNLYHNIFNASDASFIIQLVASDNHIENIDDGAFDGLECLHYLELQNNNISHTTNLTFSKLKLLRQLNLSGNNLKEIPDNVFAFNVNLKHLMLTNNKIAILSHRSFYNLTSLEVLDLSSNQLITIDPETLSFCEKLLVFDLSFNKFTYLQLEKFNLTKLHRLNLAGNNRKVFDVGQKFPYATSLRYLDLGDNNLTKLNPFKLRKAFPNLITLRLSGNPWNCYELTHIVMALENSGVNFTRSQNNNSSATNIRGIYCSDVDTTNEAQTLVPTETVNSEGLVPTPETPSLQSMSLGGCLYLCLIIIVVSYVVGYLSEKFRLYQILRDYCRRKEIPLDEGDRECNLENNRAAFLLDLNY